MIATPWGNLTGLQVAGRYIEDNDRGDEDPSEPARWTLVIEAELVLARPIHQIAFTHKVTV